MNLKKHQKHNTIQPLHHIINLTPILDLMLVLLVIFIIAASGIVTSSIDLNLPIGKSNPNKIIQNYLEITLDKNLKIYISDAQMDVVDVENYLINMNLPKDQQIALKIDSSIKYKDLIILISQILGAGYKNFSLITQDA